jgi:hypothetical protein
MKLKTHTQRIEKRGESKEKKRKKKEITETKKQPSIFTPIMHSKTPYERTAFPSIPIRSEPS